MGNNTTAPGASMYEKADEYLESVLMALDKSDDPASFETLKTVVYIAKLNQLFHQIETSPNHGKAEAIGRLLGTDFLDIHIYVTGENTLELKMFDAIRRRAVLKMTFTDRSYLWKQNGAGRGYYTQTGQSFLPEEGQKAEKSGKEPPDKQTAPYKPEDIIAERRRWVKRTETKEAQREPEAESALHLDSYEQIGTAEFDKHFYLQRANDLLEQIDRLRHLDAYDDPELQMAISKAIFDAYYAFDQIIYSR